MTVMGPVLFIGLDVHNDSIAVSLAPSDSTQVRQSALKMGFGGDGLAADPNISKRANVNLTSALARLTTDQQQDVERRVAGFHALAISEMDPKVKDWQKNPAYQQEDGQFGH